MTTLEQPATEANAQTGVNAIVSSAGLAGQPEPFYKDESVTLYHGSAETILPALKIEVACCFNELPFNHQGGDEKDYVTFVEKITAAQIPLLKDGGNFVVLNNPANLFKTAHCYQSLEFRNEVPLIRGPAFFPAWHLGFRHNSIWLLAKGNKKGTWGGARVNHQSGLSDVWDDETYYSGARIGGVFHPQAIPMWLARRVVELTTNVGDALLDPTAGLGTIGQACKDLGRKYVAIELQKQYCDVMAGRFSQGALLAC